MRSLTKRVVNGSDRLCLSDSHVRQLLDRWKTNRLFELYSHTVPSFGLALFVSDLTFKSNHQPFRAIVSKHNGAGRHINAVQQIVEQEWFCGLHELWCSSPTSSRYVLNLALMNLTNFLFGKDSSLTASLRAQDSSRLDECVRKSSQHNFGL